VYGLGLSDESSQSDSPGVDSGVATHGEVDGAGPAPGVRAVAPVEEDPVAQVCGGAQRRGPFEAQEDGAGDGRPLLQVLPPTEASATLLATD
jgi:hypothetical protein